MKTYYCVTSTVYGSGHVTAAITDTVEAGAKPGNRVTEKRDRDIYTDYFETLAKAEQFIKDAKRA
jgi:hypothetical protein